jgi:sulfate adenylyltransferase subunit 1 (EFTu-like GTPase family)
MISAADARPKTGREIEATLCWLGESPGMPGGRYLLKHTTRTERAKLEVVHDTLHVATLETRPGGDSLGLNDIGRVTLRCASELVYDPYGQNRLTGAFILIDETTNDTVGAGMIADTARPHTAETE